jgi:hypothetical protein
MEKVQSKGHKKPPKRSLKSLVSNFFNSDTMAARRLYKVAKQDAGKIREFMEAFSTLSKPEKKKLYKMMDGNYEHCVRMLRNCDMIESETENVIRIVVESGGPEYTEEVRSTIGKELGELVFEGTTRNIKTRKFAFDMIIENDLNATEFAKKVLETKNDIEMKNHALQTVLDMKISDNEIIEIIKALDSAMTAGFPLNDNIVDKLVELAKSFDEKPECIISVLAKLRDTDEIVKKILQGRAHEKEAKLAGSVILKQMKMAVEEGAQSYKEANSTLAFLLSNKSIRTRELVALGLEEHIRERNVFADRTARAVITLADALLADADFDTNIDGAEILYSLRFMGEAKRRIRDIAIPDLNDMANDETYDEGKRGRALVMLKKLGSVK